MSVSGVIDVRHGCDGDKRPTIMPPVRETNNNESLDAALTLTSIRRLPLWGSLPPPPPPLPPLPKLYVRLPKVGKGFFAVKTVHPHYEPLFRKRKKNRSRRKPPDPELQRKRRYATSLTSVEQDYKRVRLTPEERELEQHVLNYNASLRFVPKKRYIMMIEPSLPPAPPTPTYAASMAAHAWKSQEPSKTENGPVTVNSMLALQSVQPIVRVMPPMDEDEVQSSLHSRTPLPPPPSKLPPPPPPPPSLPPKKTSTEPAQPTLPSPSQLTPFPKAPVANAATEGDTKQPFTCAFCKRAFMYRCDFIRHLRTHTNERPFACQHCKKTFKQKGTLTTHMRTHTGERPFQCPVCAKKFTQKSPLTAHMRTHTNNRPFVCSLCSRGFKQKGNLTTHMRTHRYTLRSIVSYPNQQPSAVQMVGTGGWTPPPPTTPPPPPPAAAAATTTMQPILPKQPAPAQPATLLPEVLVTQSELPPPPPTPSTNEQMPVDHKT